MTGREPPARPGILSFPGALNSAPTIRKEDIMKEYGYWPPTSTDTVSGTQEGYGYDWGAYEPPC